MAERQEAYSEWFKKNKIYMWPFDRYKYIDDGGIYTGSQSVHNPGKEGYRYDVIHPITGKPCQQPLMGYRFPLDTMGEMLRNGRILFGEDETKIIEIKLYVQEYRAKLPSIIEMDTRLGANELHTIFPEDKRVFGFSKPSQFIYELLSFTTTPNSIILDSFAGSGTTAHAVLQLNKQDGGQRKFILVEMDSSIAPNITAERLKRVITGYSKSDGLGGGFSYCQLGPTLFDESGQIRAQVSFLDLARHIYFIETGAPLPAAEAPEGPLLGVQDGRAVYLLYNGILKDKDPQGGNILTLALLKTLPEHLGP
ncbi:MAG TPA: DNA methyltransferase, partial [Tenuifilaceae bacterium]|nr:DNA methyltransferase [Tenuifilaceae bacterium]